jgi:tight adherence protein B
MDPLWATMAGLVALCLCGLAFAFVNAAGGRRLARRARRLGHPGRQRPTTGPQLRRESQIGALDAALLRLLPQPAALRARLLASGTGLTIGRYGVICLVVGIVTAGGLLACGSSPGIALLVGLFALLWAPHAAIGAMAKFRRARFAKSFPEAIGLVVRGLKAGIPVTETMLVVGREVAGPVGEEFRQIGDQIKLGQRLEEALRKSAARLDLAEFNFFVITLSVQRETGGNLAETLENLDDILRKRQYMRQKVKAMSSEATASAGIIGCLPFVNAGMLFMVKRDYIMTLFTAPLGRTMLIAAGISLAVGILIMARMVKFEI